MPEEQQLARRFTEKEVSAILKRAVELQAAVREDGLGAAEPGGGTSLVQIRQAAAELGLEPRLVEQAALEVAAACAPRGRSGFWGGPWNVRHERVVDGTMTEQDWPALLAEIRRATGRVGDVSAVGKALEWSSVEPDTLHVSAVPEGDRTRIQVTGRFGSWGAMCYLISTTVAVLLSLGLCTTHHWPVLLNLALVTGLLTTSFATARTVFNRLCSARRRMAQGLVERLERRIGQRVDPALAVAAEGSREPESYIVSASS
jgi:hypothetical protein